MGEGKGENLYPPGLVFFNKKGATPPLDPPLLLYNVALLYRWKDMRVIYKLDSVLLSFNKKYLSMHGRYFKSQGR